MVLKSLSLRLDCVPFGLAQAHRRLTVAELARLQGFSKGELPWKEASTPTTKRGGQVGNAMAVPVLEEAMRSVIEAAGLV